MKRKAISITKASGESAPYSEEKLLHSLKNSGATDTQANDIVTAIRPQLYEGIPTKQIYRKAFQLLRKQSRYLAARYHLKRGIMELGPSGFPFEKYIGELLKAQGYRIRLGEIVKGQCVSHEIDVIAEKDHSHFMIECKYHNQQGIACDVKIPLYVQARFKDVEAAWVQLPKHSTKFHQGWVVTNTRFTKDAIQYGVCAGLNLLGWNYPLTKNLKELIDTLGLYPLTCLTSLTKHEKQQLLEKHVVLCKDIITHTDVLRQIGIHEPRRVTITEEARKLCREK